MCGQIAYVWNTMPSPRFSGGTKIPFSVDHTISSPMAISPASGVSSPTMHRNSVVLPQPLGPRRVKIRLAGMVRSMLSRARIRFPSE